MSWYRKKPLPVRAVQWTGLWTDEVQELERYSQTVFDDTTDGLILTTVDGNTVRVPINAYIVLDPKGYPYPCDKGIFEAGNEPVTDRVDVFEGADEQWHWHRQDAGNNEVLSSGEAYVDKAGAITGALGANTDFIRDMLNVETGRL